MRGAILSALLLAGPAVAQDAPASSAEAADNLRGFVRGFAAECAERCAASGAGSGCGNGCTCLVANVAHRIDPLTLEAGGKALPSPDDIVAFVTANRDAFVAAYEICDIPLQ